VAARVWAVVHRVARKVVQAWAADVRR
jgi:hypothetical protein